MRIIITLFFIAISSITLSAQIDSLQFVFEQDSFSVGDTIRISIECKSRFSLQTTGDCKETKRVPSIIKAYNGRFPDLVYPILCCGRSNYGSFTIIPFEFVATEAGIYKVTVPSHTHGTTYSPRIIVRE